MNPPHRVFEKTRAKGGSVKPEFTVVVNRLFLPGRLIEVYQGEVRDYKGEI